MAGGLDGVINDDRLGLSKIYVQAKRRATEYKVSRTDVQAFVGSLMGQKARQGVFITSSGFTQEARDYVSGMGDLPVVLIDSATSAELMIDHDVGVSEQERCVINRLDRDYFEEARGAMRQASQGRAGLNSAREGPDERAPRLCSHR